ncbi:Eco57I restriction-modification methylase domain-containing protein [Romboutsia sp. 1001713B170207_170306_H8]|uniref:Eco57I restriction-modification methylase domain-containing protein n=1 Tax=Romboutsia sp. 1001713B170207_170306_H8 TaxID=2787112 RepID=UPI001FAC15F6|nr:DNA methyltransferase [Romboutsia sp. 1001713B170207_170306_H8]
MKHNLGEMEIEIDNFYSSKNYEQSLEIEFRKSKGIYYTPKVIVNYIMEKTLKNHDIVNNPCPRVLDMSCGCGNFLLQAYDILYDLLEENIFDLKEKYKSDYWCLENIHKHIVENCIFGIDIDSNAIKILKQSLWDKDTNINNIVNEDYNYNIYNDDGLKKEWEFKFDYIVGNPPYVGHKSLDKEYKKYLIKEFNQVYKDKSDLYFCFYKRAIDLLNDNGVMSMITPRYFLESPSGNSLRLFIKDNASIKEIVDFLGAKVFKNVGIASCIITMSKILNSNNYIDVYKAKNEDIKINELEDLNSLLNSFEFDKFSLNQKLLDKNWIITNSKDREFYNNIESICEYSLGDIVNSFQGVITGCDKAFIIDGNNKKDVPDNILKVWVKNKNIKKYVIEKSNYNLIYSNDIDNQDNYKEVIDKFIMPYKSKLENRRECKRNVRKWYELQWGREKSLFERIKIMYPYKSKCNRFAIDYSNLYCSADVYSFYIKDEYINEFSNEYLVAILNSNIYDRYFKINAKNMGKEIYDYYPNKVMEIKIFKDDNYEEIESKCKQILKILYNKNLYEEYEFYHEEVCKLEYEINDLIKSSLKL